MINQKILDSLGTGLLSPHFSSPGGTSLLPQAFKEGAPAHPSYASGHATVAGACVTVLKAWFDESEVFDPSVITIPQLHLPDSVLQDMQTSRQAVMTDATCNLVPYTGPVLTVGNELNKLAGNIAQARNAAGVHYRSDYTEGLLLGEEIAIRDTSGAKVNLYLLDSEEYRNTATRLEKDLEELMAYPEILERISVPVVSNLQSFPRLSPIIKTLGEQLILAQEQANEAVDILNTLAELKEAEKRGDKEITLLPRLLIVQLNSHVMNFIEYYRLKNSGSQKQ